MGGGSLSTPRRQPAIRLFAREYFESDLVERGSGEFDPTFVITKLGAKVNRMMVAGLLERMERRDGETGANYRGSIRDPTGLHMFNVGSFQPELHVRMEELIARYEMNAEPILLLVIGKASPYQSDDGGVFTGMRLEDYTITDGTGYANWLVGAADATLRRIDVYQRSQDTDATVEAFREADIPNDLSSGLISARGHYTNVDPDVYMMSVLTALDRAEGNLSSLSQPEPSDAADSDEGGQSGVDQSQVKEWICEYLLANDPGDGVAYDPIMADLAGRMISRADGEAAVDALLDDGMVFEHTFGFIRHIDAN